MSANHKSEKTDKITHKTQKKDGKLPMIVFLVVLLLVGLIVVFQGKSDNTDKKADTANPTDSSNSNGKARLFLKPASQQVSAGTSVTVEVWVGTAGEPVNAVQANLTYPQDKFDFGRIDAKGSAFEVQALSTGGNGKVSIARGHIGNVKGVSLVAKVVLNAKSDKGNAEVSFAEGSAVVRSTDHTDILKEKAGAKYEISRIPGRTSLLYSESTS